MLNITLYDLHNFQHNNLGDMAFITLLILMDVKARPQIDVSAQDLSES